MSSSNDNDTDGVGLPIPSGPPEWLKKAQESEAPARVMFPRSRIGLPPEEDVAPPVAPMAPTSAPTPAAEPAPTSSPAAARYAPPSAVPVESAESASAPIPVAPSSSAFSSPSVAPDTYPAAPSWTSTASSRSDEPGVSVTSFTTSTTYPVGKPGGSVVAAPSRKLSIWSMALGLSAVVLSIIFLGFLPALAAVILGHLAQRREPAARPLWLTGLITGYLSLVVSSFFLVVVIIAFVEAFAAVDAVP
jgi:hypothetical protein